MSRDLDQARGLAEVAPAQERAAIWAAIAQASALERIADQLEQMNDGGTLRMEQIR